MINIKDFDPNLLSIDKISFKSTDPVIYSIKYITMKSNDYQNFNRENHSYIIFNNVDGYIEEGNGDKYLILASTNRNKKVFKKYTELWEIKNKIETINGGKPIKYEKVFMRLSLNEDDDLPLAKILSIPSMIIVVGSVFQKGNKYYPQVYLHGCLCEFVNEL